MTPNGNLQVWLETSSENAARLIVPYVRSDRDMEMQFNVELVQRCAGGSSRICQRGRVQARTGLAVPLARMSLGAAPQEECRIEIVLTCSGREPAVFRFDCTD